MDPANGEEDDFNDRRENLSPSAGMAGSDEQDQNAGSINASPQTVQSSPHGNKPNLMLQKNLTRKSSSQHFKESDLRASQAVAQLWGKTELHDENIWFGAQRNFTVQCLETMRFQIGIGGVIMMNAVTIGLETDALAKNEELDYMYPIEVLFTVIYILEISVKIFGYGCKIFKEFGFLSDLFLVLLAITDTFILGAFDVASQLSQFMMLRMLRLFKLARILRLLKLFRELWLLLSSIIDSLRLLIWCGILLTLLLYLAGILTTQLIGVRLNSEDLWSEDEDRHYLRLRFGSVDRSMYTLFECMVGGDITQVARVVYKGMPWLWVFFVIYTCVAVIAILNVIVAVIVENTMKKTIAENREDKRREMEEQREALRKDLIKLFQMADSTGDGSLSRDEWISVIDDQEIMKSITQLQLTRDQCLHIFDACDTDGSKTLDSMEFLEGVMKGVHAVRVYDVMGIAGGVKNIEERMKSLQKHVAPKMHREGSAKDEFNSPERDRPRSNESNSPEKEKEMQVVDSRVEERIKELLHDQTAALEQRIERIEFQQTQGFEHIQKTLNVMLSAMADNKGMCASFAPPPRQLRVPGLSVQS